MFGPSFTGFGSSPALTWRQTVAVLVLRQPATVGRRTYALSGSLSKFASAAGSVGLLACEVVAVATGIVGEWIGVALKLRIRVFRCGVNVPATGRRVLRHQHVLSACDPGPRKPWPWASLALGNWPRVVDAGSSVYDLFLGS